MKLSRQEFLLGALGVAALGTVTTGCDGGTSTPPPGGGGTPPPDGGGTIPDAGGGGGGGPNCIENGTTAEISANHGHTLVVSREDVSVGADKVYLITGSANHPHTVTVTAAMFAILANNNPITITSSDNSSHTHQVTVSCV